MPLYIISKILCIHPFSRNPLQVSFVGGTIAGLIALGYASFHLTSAKLSMNTATNESDSNFVAVIIDSYNRYSGLCCFTVIVTTAISMQGKMVEAIRILEEVDVLLAKDLAFVVDNFAWAR